MKFATPTTIKPLASIALLLVAACGGGEPAPVDGVTADEARALNDAAEMLDARDNTVTEDSAR